MLASRTFAGFGSAPSPGANGSWRRGAHALRGGSIGSDWLSSTYGRARVRCACCGSAMRWRPQSATSRCPVCYEAGWVME